MRFDLASNTDVAVHGIFDPAAMLHVINDPQVQHIDDEVLAGDVESGNILLYSCGSDGAAKFRVFVDQEPGEDLLALGREMRCGLLLRVPSGMLAAAGIEHLCRPGQKPVSPAEFEAVCDWMGSSAQIPAGNYLLDAFSMPPEEDAAALCRWLGRAKGWGCGLTFLATLAAVIAPLAGLAEAIYALLAWCIFFIAVWLPVAILDQIVKRKPSILGKLEEARARRRRFPFDAVVVLRPLPADAELATLCGGAFGSGFPREM